MSVPPQNLVVLDYRRPSEPNSQVYDVECFSVFSQHLSVSCQARSHSYRFFQTLSIRKSQATSHALRARSDQSLGSVSDSLHESRDILKVSSFSRSAKGDASSVDAARHRTE